MLRILIATTAIAMTSLALAHGTEKKQDACCPPTSKIVHTKAKPLYPKDPRANLVLRKRVEVPAECCVEAGIKKAKANLMCCHHPKGH